MWIRSSTLRWRASWRVTSLLDDYALFKRLRVDPEAGTIVWPNGADVSPRTLYRQSRDVVPS